MELTNIIIKPYLTEKTFTVREASEKKVYAFIVDKRANKNHIKNAFVAIYGVNPEKVNTIKRKSTKVRTGTAKPGFSKVKKIAYVTLPKGVDIAVEADEIEEAKDAK